MDMTANIRRQQEQIVIVTKDISGAEGQIASLSEKNKKLFEELEDRIVKSAQSSAVKKEAPKDTKKVVGASSPPPPKSAPTDPFVIDLSRRLIEVHEAYSALMKLIELRGEVKRDQHEADEKKRET